MFFVVFLPKGWMTFTDFFNKAELLIMPVDVFRVGEHSAENSMEPRNLAICWWPTLMRPQVTSFDKIMLISKASEEIILDLIQHHEFYFGGG